MDPKHAHDRNQPNDMLVEVFKLVFRNSVLLMDARSLIPYVGVLSSKYPPANPNNTSADQAPNAAGK